MGVLVDNHHLDVSKFYLVGFSLGAQVAGMAAHYFSNTVKPGITLPRITGDYKFLSVE
jgi:dienelactone hydrolase